MQNNAFLDWFSIPRYLHWERGLDGHRMMTGDDTGVAPTATALRTTSTVKPPAVSSSRAATRSSWPGCRSGSDAAHRSAKQPDPADTAGR
jgi:hypothetical protein